MGYQHNDICYPDALSVARSYCSSLSGQIQSINGYPMTSNASEPFAVTSTLWACPLSWVAGGKTPVYSTGYATLFPCGLIETSDAISISWGIAIAWTFAFALRHLRRAV